jgi:hypothetical protein
MKRTLIFLLPFFFSACASYDQFVKITRDFEIPTKVYKSDFTQTWAAVVSVMKKYDIEQQNQEAGVIKTRWMDNTLEVNFADSFGSNDRVKAAKFKLLVNVIKGFRYGREVTKVSVYKRQVVEQDFLQGWKEVSEDQILEKTILYRIRRFLDIDNKLEQIQQQKEKEQIDQFT